MEDDGLNRNLTRMEIAVEGVSDILLDELTPIEVVCGESILTPGLQTSIKLHTHKFTTYEGRGDIKNFDEFRGRIMTINLNKPSLKDFGIKSEMTISHPIYRMDKRKLYNNNTDEFYLHLTHKTLLEDAVSLMTKLWKCKTPSQVVEDVLRGCIGASLVDIEPSNYRRDYEANNIHPYQVIAQQANAALHAGNDSPSFLHYMTYEIGSGDGIHHFESLDRMVAREPLFSGNNHPRGGKFYFSEIEGVDSFGDPFGMITHSFPCDFDLLTDLMNGSNNGQTIGSYVGVNQVLGTTSHFGQNLDFCNKGVTVPKAGLSNWATAKRQNMCPDYAHLFAQKRQARMALIEQDKIALRMTVPWNPELHAGQTIYLELLNKLRPELPIYGNGKYLIHSLTHNIKQGGYATTTIDCVSQSVGTTATV